LSNDFTNICLRNFLNLEYILYTKKLCENSFAFILLIVLSAIIAIDMYAPIYPIDKREIIKLVGMFAYNKIVSKKLKHIPNIVKNTISNSS